MSLVDQIKADIKTMLGQVEISSLSFYGYAQNDQGVTMDISGSVYKMDEEQRMVYGFASVIEVEGESLVDKHGDIIEEQDLVNAAHIFMSEYRSGKEMHKGEDVGEVVESLVLTKDIQKMLGCDLGMVGWLVGYKVYDDAVWEKVKKGELAMFSIGGKAEREKISE